MDTKLMQWWRQRRLALAERRAERYRRIDEYWEKERLAAEERSCKRKEFLESLLPNERANFLLRERELSLEERKMEYAHRNTWPFTD